MDERNRQNFEVINNNRERVNEVSEKSVLSHHTNPIVKKLLDFSSSDKTCKLSVRDLLKR